MKKKFQCTPYSETCSWIEARYPASPKIPEKLTHRIIDSLDHENAPDAESKNASALLGRAPDGGEERRSHRSSQQR